MDAGLFITLLTFTAVPLTMTAQWFLSKGSLHIALPILVVVYSLYLTLETFVALRNPEQHALLLCDAVNIWGIVMSVKGIRRLRNKTIRG